MAVSDPSTRLEIIFTVCKTEEQIESSRQENHIPTPLFEPKFCIWISYMLTIEIVIYFGGAPAAAILTGAAVFVGLRAPPAGVLVMTLSVPVAEPVSELAAAPDEAEGKGAGAASAVVASATIE